MPHRPRVVAFLVGSPGDLINLVGVASVFSYPKVGDQPVYDVKILSMHGAYEVRGFGGLTLCNCIPFSEYAGPIDILAVVGGETSFTEPPPDAIRWLRDRAPQSRRIVSVCTGAFILARTGLLDGKRVTTHWHHAPKLAQRYPKIKMERDSIFIKDGNTYSTAGVTAGIDMALSIVEDDVGQKAAAAIAHTLVLYHRRPSYEAQYSTLLAQQSDVSGTRLRDLPAWAKSRLTQKLDVNTLARAVSMTPRTFARQFELHFKTTPARWVQSLRVEAACSLLAADDMPMKAIAKLTGLRDEQSLRRVFLQQLKITPKEYREKFGLLRGVRNGHPQADRAADQAVASLSSV
jgi:transcriptional regulator GlxA family with amidase domain